MKNNNRLKRLTYTESELSITYKTKPFFSFFHSLVNTPNYTISEKKSRIKFKGWIFCALATILSNYVLIKNKNVQDLFFLDKYQFYYRRLQILENKIYWVGQGTFYKKKLTIEYVWKFIETESCHWELSDSFK